MPGALSDLRWDNSFVRLGDEFYQRVRPTPLPGLRLLAYNPAAAALLGLDPKIDSAEFLAGINGERPIPGTDPVATLYAGHQFGVWVPQLGDGRAILLGEVINARHERWDVQIKGSGLTKYSRMGDGRAVLRSTIREYLASEAMQGLGIPSTRGLALAASDAPVHRERVESAALLVRLAPSHIRFGHFEVFASRGMQRESQRLADYVIEQHFSHLLVLPARTRYAAWYREVVDRTARLIALWTAVGFAHGVLNTDNMSIIGVTLDYGPYAWLDAYQRDFIPNHSDPEGRYAFGQQPRIGLWNCARLGEALHPLVGEDDAVASLNGYRETFEREIDRLIRTKLGLATIETDDLAMVAALLDLLHDTATDYTRFFRTLSHFSAADPASVAALRALVCDTARLDHWLMGYGARLARESSTDAERQARMLRANPGFVLRNWMAQEVIEQAEAGVAAPIEQLRALLAAPFDEHPEGERYAAPPPAWAREIVVSCSS